MPPVPILSIIALLAVGAIAWGETPDDAPPRHKPKKHPKAQHSEESKKTPEDAHAPPPAAPPKADNDPAASAKPKEEPPAMPPKKVAAVSSITEEEIKNFADYPPALQAVLRKAIELTHQNLIYQYGSCDPAAGGMDCSGSMYYVLRQSGASDVPRQSDEMCRWVMRRTALYRTEDAEKITDLPYSSLQPGDLVFWTGTYDPATTRLLPITHVMMYIGRRKKDNKPLLFGSSEGRNYDGQRRNGVSIFDFPVPKHGDKSAIYGYGRVPGLKLEVVRKAEVKTE